MNRLALAVRAASNDAYLKTSLEALAEDLTQSNVSMEQHFDDIQNMVDLAHGLETVVISVESIDSPSLAQQSAARNTALDYLKLSGLSHSDAVEIFPSLEAEDGSSAWTKFKEFLARVWKFIIESAKKVYEFLNKVFKQSSLAEKAAMVKLRDLRTQLATKRNGLTHEAKLPLRPAHRYLFSPSNELSNLASLQANVNDFIKARDKVQSALPAVVQKAAADMTKVVNGLALSGTPQQVSDSIEKHLPAMLDAVRPMFPEGLAKTLGAKDYEIPLIHDRTLRIRQPIAERDSLITAEEAKAYVTQFGIEVVQSDGAFNSESLGTFPALSIADIEKVLKTAEELIDSGHSADQQSQWQKTRRNIVDLADGVDTVVSGLLKMKDLSPKARTTVMLAANARHAMDKWAAAPYTQLNTVNVRVVDSLLALAADQIKNYETTDSMQEKADKSKAEKEKVEKSKKDKDDKSVGKGNKK